MSEGKLPLAAHGLQLNFCKTLACDNFGLSEAKYYILQRVNPKRPAMVCRECGAFPPLLNNQDVLDELARLKALQSEGLPSCKNPACENAGVSVHTHKEKYHAFGFSGDRQRYRCKACQSTFVDKWSGQNKKRQFQESLLAFLFTGYSVREICRKLSINPKTFYDHIEHIASRCRRKLAMIDARWLNHASQYELASCYRELQAKSSNGVFWFTTGDAQSGYILCQHLNYSAEEASGDASEHDAYKPTTRIVEGNFEPEANEAPVSHASSLRQKIDDKYKTILARSNVEDPMGNFSKFNYPSKGALIRPQYTSHAHYLRVLEQVDDGKRLTIYMPQDPLLRSAALSVCLPRIKQNNVDLLYVEQDGDWENSQSNKKIDVALMGWWRDRWAIAKQVDPDSSHEVHKGICYLAGDNPDLSTWLSQASTAQIEYYQNRFQVLFEDFINEPRRKLRPGGLIPLLDIFRAWHNLCYQDKSGQTPAQRLNAAASPMTLKQLLA
ncbi:lactate dehydrogenase [Vibrio sp. ZSDZ34]|uniref:Lactate dehydrogenase n=1 Tax=Vibrio gelatinilyticus TaxID=2893468 RepID=A0A9X2AY11_9VIBR|nr:lactate dehydrogenase [Vibrio gelatinilyticus]